MKPLRFHPLFRATLTFAAIAATLGLCRPTARAYPEYGARPGPASCETGVAPAGPLLSTQVASWSAQSAPGFMTSPAADTEKTWLALHGWVKVPIPSADAEGSRKAKGRRAKDKKRADGALAPAEALLPDPWSRGDRGYDAAWYVLRADFGERLPETLWLRFDAVAHQCEAFVNGTHVGGHIGGYTPFQFDITSAAHPGVNTIALYVRDEHAVVYADRGMSVSQLGVDAKGSFTSMAGICGGVYFDARPAVHADHLLIRTSTRKKEIEVTTSLGGPAPEGATVTGEVYSWPDGTDPVLQLPAATIPPGQSSVRVAVPWADARRWSPEHPDLYVLRARVAAGGTSETVETRFGFREFWTEGKDFILNGSPIRLLGVSVADDENMTIAGSPEAGREYVRAALEFEKRAFNYRAIRYHATIHPPEAIQGADEAGFLVIDQSSIWSAVGSYYGSPDFMKNTRNQFTEWYWRDANNPSVVIWDVANEMLRGQRTPERMKWVLTLDTFIRDLDPTRIVEQAGDAWYSPDQQTIHVHMKERYDAVERTWQATGKAPLVFGEFWIGGQSGEDRLTDGYEFGSRLDWQEDESRLYRERMLQMRNYGASGVMPFWMDMDILGRTHESLWRTFDPAKDKIYFWRFPGMRNLGAEALSPVVAFAWPRSQSALEGTALEKEIVVCNDTEETRDLAVSCDFAGDHKEWKVTLTPAAQDRHKVSFPAGASGDLVVKVADADAGGREWPGDTLAIHVIAAGRRDAPKLSRRLVVVPAPSSEVAAALGELGLDFQPASELPADAKGTIVLVPPGTGRDALGRTAAGVRAYLHAGGRMLILAQNEAPNWMPINLPFWSALAKSALEFDMILPPYTRDLFYSKEAPLYAPGHPAFAGLAPEDLRWWNATDGRVSDDAFSRPGALDIHTGAPYRVLAGACRRENASLLETRIGDGTAIVCQAQVINQREAPAATALFMNLLRYLDGPAWKATEDRIAVAGNLTPGRLAQLIDLPADSFVPASLDPGAPKVVLAGDSADVGQLDALARAGHTVVVLSCETAARLPGYAVDRAPGVIYAGTRAGAADDPLFWGVATGNFLPLEESPAKGAFTMHPAGARVLLGGLSNAERVDYWRGHPDPIEILGAAGPIALAESRGDGEWIATTLEPWNPRVESDRQLLATLLANAGVRLRSEAAGQAEILAKATIPVRIDGRLDDWTNDLADRNVSPYQHAEPIPLTSRDAVAGRVANDSDLSAVLYLLHDNRYLYLAGIVFSEDGSAKAEYDLDGHAIAVDLADGSMRMDGREIAGGRIATGQARAGDLADTRLLSIVAFDAHVDRSAPAPETRGTTFEAAIPWTAFGDNAPPEALRGLFRVVRDGDILQIPNSPQGSHPPSLTVRVGAGNGELP